jgi:hypothetical protein
VTGRWRILKMIEKLDGSKGNGDQRILFHGHQVTFKEVAQVVLELCSNEDKIYPKPRFRGGQMLLDFLQEAYDEGVSDELLRKYKL